ncbi:hypothetical protein AYO38_05440 [bacterium SCGC AG-212-C10]|nr:hypothetical protein AYO38_05440 [bacterium SCGC AG-212-C10]
MASPRQVLAQLLSPAQADALADAAENAWNAVTRVLGVIMDTEPGLSALDARLVMPDEISNEFGDPHLVAPVELSTDMDQTATAYAIFKTLEAAPFLGSEAADAEEQEQQTLVIASTILGQAVAALNREIFKNSPAGLVLALEDMTANSMPEILAMLDEPGLSLSGSIVGSAAASFVLLLPGTFLDVLAGALPVAEAPAAAAAPMAASPAAQRPASDLPFSLTLDDIESAELIDSEPETFPAQQYAAPAPQPTQMRNAAFVGAGVREPTPITAAPAAHRARFAPLPEPEPPSSRSNIDLLAGLQMNVSVELGRTQLTVADVLGLGPGSVIELDRLAGEPVDILVNDRLVARGEVVVVDENFGVRVVEVVRRGHENDERAG